MIDFHTHILPDIDDGPRSLEESLEMCRIAVLDGITTMVATPHGPGSKFGHRYSTDLVYARLQALQAALEQTAWPIEILPGTEIAYHTELPKLLKAGALLPCGSGGAVLLELPLTHLPSGLDQLVFDLQVAGYRVVLTHPERISVVQKHPNLLIPLIERGVLMQMTSRALTGQQGSHMQRLAETLLTHRMIHLLASDAHDTSPRRSPHLAEACRHAAALMGEAAARALVQDTPAALLSGKEIELPPPQPVKRARRWRLFW